MTFSARRCFGLFVLIFSQPAAAATYQSPFADYKPFREQELRSWAEVNKEVADNPMGHPMGAMKGMTGHAGHDMGATKSAPGAAAPAHDMAAMKDKAGHKSAAGHDMAAMKGAPGKAGAHGHDMAAMKAGSAKAGAPAHDMSAMKGAASQKSSHVHDMGAMKEARTPTVAMVNPNVAPARSAPSRPASATGTALVQAIDKANARIKLTHDPIAALNWPKLTLFFRLKDRALADQVKQGDKVGFSLERQETGFVISGFHKTPWKDDAK